MKTTKKQPSMQWKIYHTCMGKGKKTSQIAWIFPVIGSISMVNLGKYTVVPWHPSWFPTRHRATSDTFDLCRGIQRCAGREDGVGETKIWGLSGGRPGNVSCLIPDFGCDFTSCHGSPKPTFLEVLWYFFFDLQVRCLNSHCCPMVGMVIGLILGVYIPIIRLPYFPGGMTRAQMVGIKEGSRKLKWWYTCNPYFQEISNGRTYWTDPFSPGYLITRSQIALGVRWDSVLFNFLMEY